MSDDEAIDERDFDASVWAPRRRYEVRRPPYFDVEERDGCLRLSHRWFSATTFLTLVVALAFWAVPIYMYFKARLDGPLDGGQWFAMSLVLLLFVPTGLLLFYGFLTGIFNRSVIKITPRQIDIRIGPLPAWGNMTIDARTVAQVYCRVIRSTGSRGRTRTSYVLASKMIDGDDRVIYQATGYKEDLQYLEQQIEKVLGIRDEVVEGEAP